MNIDVITLFGSCISTGLLSIGITLLILSSSASTQTEINQGLIEINEGLLKLDSELLVNDKMLHDEIMVNRNNIHAIYKHLQEVEP